MRATVLRQKRLYDQRAVRRLFAIGDWVMRYYPPAKKCKLDLMMLAMFARENRDDWDDLLPAVMMAYGLKPVNTRAVSHHDRWK